jgi:exodeoxyribonuclease V alpha subunit
MKYDIDGILNKIIYTNKNKDNTIYIVLFIINENNRYKITGNVIFMPEIGDYIIASGIYEDFDSNYNQICINKCNIIINLPKDNHSIYERLYDLYSNKIDNLIIKNLSNIENIWNILDNNKLEDIIKLDNLLYEHLYDIYYKYIDKRINCEYQKLYHFFRNNNIILKSTQINYLLQKYLLAQTIIDIIIDKNNNYKILELLDIDTIGIKTLINICNSLNMTNDKKINICIIYSLTDNPNGHSCLKINELQNILYNYCNNYKIKYKNFDNNLLELQNNNYIYVFENYIYTKIYYEAETKISQFLVNLSKSPSILNKYYSTAYNYIKNYKIKENILLNEEQINACMQMFKNNFCINIGKAGTGKSCSIIIPLLYFYTNVFDNISILCLAPTGKACERLNSEFKNLNIENYYEACTIHKFIFYFNNKIDDELENKDTLKITLNEIIDIKSINIKIIIIDEFSMVDLLTFYKFIKKIKKLKNICLILLGDCNQLPSVNVGDILHRLIKSNIFPVVELTKVVRSNNNIVTLSNNILDCLPLFNNIKKSDKDIKIEWIKINPEDKNNKQIILDNIKSLHNPLILTSTNKLIDYLHEDIRLILNPKLDILSCIYNLKISSISEENLLIINDLELKLINYKKLFDNEIIYNDIIKINKSISNNDIMINFFNIDNFSLKNTTEFLLNLNFEKINNLIKKFINNYCKKFEEINKIFNYILKECIFANNKYFNYLFNTFNNDFNDEYDILKYKYRLYDKIIVIKNNYNLQLMNGMIGEIILFDNYNKYITIKFNNKKIQITNDEFIEMVKLSFLITIHKSQGSESDNVIILLNDSKLNSINLLYTAVTRAKYSCIIISENDVIEKIIKNKQIIKRNSNIHKYCLSFN